MGAFDLYSLMNSGGAIIVGAEWSLSVFITTALAQAVGLIVLLQCFLREKGQNLDSSRKHKLYGQFFVLWIINCVMFGDVFGLEDSVDMLVSVVWIVIEFWIVYFRIYKRL